MEPIRDEGFFTLYLQDNILIVRLKNTTEMPSINHFALTQLFEAMQAELQSHHLTEPGWFVLYDFSQVTHYEFTSTTAVATFFRWAVNHGRKKAALIFPTSPNGETVPIKRAVQGLIPTSARSAHDHYTTTTTADALRWFEEVLQHAHENAPH